MLPGHDDGRQVGIHGRPGAAQRAFRAGHRKIFFRQAGDDDGQFMRWQRISVVEDGRHRQVLATDRAVDDDFQPAHRGEGINGAPISPRAIMVENQHDLRSPPTLRP